MAPSRSWESFKPGGGVSNLAHLGGMIFGFVYIKTQFGRRRAFAPSGGGFHPARTWKQYWKDYKLKRAKKKFDVYLRKHGSGPGPWTN